MPWGRQAVRPGSGTAHTRSRRRRVLLWALVVGLVVGAVPATAGAATTTTLTGCGTIDTSGTYVLNQSLLDTTSDPCITVSASDVVFDGDGYAIDGTGNGTGVYVADGVSNVTIRDATVTDWAEGVRVEGASGVAVLNARLRNDTQAIDAGDARALTVRNTTVSDIGTVGIEGFNATNATVVDTEIDASGGAGIVFGDGDGARIENVTVANASGTGVVFSYGTENASLRAATLRNNSLGVRVRNGSDAVTVSGTTVRANDRGVAVSHSTGFDLRNSTVEGNAGIGVYLNRSNRSTVADSVVSNNDIDAIRAERSRGVHVVDSTLADTFGGSGVNLRGSPDAVVRNNEIYENTNKPIRLYEGSPNATVRNNSLNQSNAIIAYSDANTIVNNTVRNASGGVYLTNDADGNEVVGNDLVTRFPLIVDEGSDDTVLARNDLNATDASIGIILGKGHNTTVRNNTVGGARTAGIALYTDIGGRIVNNDIVAPNGTGVLVSNRSGATVVDNTVTDAAEDGILITRGSDRIDVENNTVVGSAETGIDIANGSDGTRVAGNGIRDAGSDGIEVTNATATVVEHNAVENASIVGIDAADLTNLTVSANTVNGTAGTAVTLSNVTNATVAGNALTRARGEGVVLFGGSTGVTVRNNTIRGLTTYDADGVVIDGAGGGNAVVANTITNTSGHGIDVFRTVGDSRIENNTVRLADYSGIQVEAVENVTVASNTVTRTGIDGVRIDTNATGIEVLDNDIRNTSVDGVHVHTNATDIEVLDNDIRNASDDGVTVYRAGSGIELSRNSVHNPAESAIEVVNATGGDRIVANDIDMAGDDTLETTDEPAIRVANTSNVSVRENDVRDSDAPGVVIVNGEDALVEANAVASSVVLESTAGATLRANVVNASAQFVGIGLSAGSRNATIVDNRVVTAGFVGVSITGGSNATRVENNTVERAGLAGVVVDRTAGVTVRDTTVGTVPGFEDIPGRGIAIDQAGATTVTNATVENATLGVTVNASSNVSIRSVTTTAAIERALRVTNASVATTVAGLRLSAAEGATVVSASARNVTLARVASPPDAPDGRVAIGRYVRVNNTSASASLDLTVRYTDSAVEAAGADESTLELWRHDGTWSGLSSTLDTDANTVGAMRVVTEPAVLAPLAEPASGDGGGGGGGTQPITGTPYIEVSTDEVAFGAVRANGSARATLTLSNDGSAPLALEEITLAPGSAAAFAVVEGGASGTLAPGETREVVLRYAPMSTGEHTGTLEVTSNASDDPTLAVSLSGRGVRPNLSVSPDRVTFDRQRVGSGPATATVTLTNDGTDELSVTAVSLAGPDAEVFRVVQGGSGGSLAPGDSRTVTVAYDPRRAGNHTARLRVETDDAALPTLGVTLAGSAVAPDVVTAPTALTYGEVAVNETVTRTLTVRNDGRANLSVEAPTLLGPDAGAFSLNASATGPFTLAPGEARRVRVTFRPASPGSKSAYLRLLSDDPDEPQVDVYLTNTRTVVRTNATTSGNATRVNVTVTNAEAGRSVSVAVSRPETRERTASVEAVTFTPETSGNISLSVLQRPSAPASAPRFERSNATQSAGYTRIAHSIPNAEVRNVSVTFRVAKERIRALNDTEPEEVALYRFENGSYRELPSRVVGQTDTHYVYRADSPGLSDFVTGIKRAKFRIADATVSLTEVRTGEGLEVLTQVTNTGSADGTYVVKLKRGDAVLAKRSLTIAANGTRQTAFERTFTRPGTYQLYVNDVFISNITVSAAESEGTGASTATPDTADEPSSLFGPGFGPLAALLALLFVALRRHG